MPHDERLLLERLVTQRENAERDRDLSQDRLLAAHVMIARGVGQRDVMAALTGQGPAGETGDVGVLGEET